MASRTKKSVLAPQHGVLILHGTFLIPSTSVGNGPITLVSGGVGQCMGFRSGTVGVAGVYTASLGDEGRPIAFDNDKYSDLLYAAFDVRPVASASLYAPPIPKATLLQDRLSGSGDFTFCTSQLSASVTAGTITETVGRPARDVFVDITLFVKNSNVR